MRGEMGLKKGRRTEGGRESRRKKGASLHAGKWGPISEEAKGVAGSGVKSPEKGGEERERECHQPSTHQQADRQPGRATGSGFIRPLYSLSSGHILVLQVAALALSFNGTEHRLGRIRQHLEAEVIVVCSRAHLSE